jgi:hypothetical protein
MLIYEFQGVVCVDGLVLGSYGAHLGNGLHISLADGAEARGCQNPNPSNPEGSGTPASFNRALVLSGAARKGSPPAPSRYLT